MKTLRIFTIALLLGLSFQLSSSVQAGNTPGETASATGSRIETREATISSVGNSNGIVFYVIKEDATGLLFTYIPNGGVTLTDGDHVVITVEVCESKIIIRDVVRK